MEPDRPLNPLERALVEKDGVDSGFEHTLTADAHQVTLASARHPARSTIALLDSGYRVRFTPGPPALLPELQRAFPQAVRGAGEFLVDQRSALRALLRRAAGLSRALPDQAVADYQQALAKALSALPPGVMGTEVERMVRQRVGQQRFREAMLDYWGGACAVTGVIVPAVLRASHARPWADCASDAERLDVFNGLLLTANLDALFDRFLISFDEQGRLLTSPALVANDLRALGVTDGMRLRWIAPEHQVYLAFHQARLRDCE